MSSSTTAPRAEQVEPDSADEASESDLLRRAALVQTLDSALSKRVTVISAPPGSGKTSLLRAWTKSSDGRRQIAFVSVDRGEQDARRFWSMVLDALRGPKPSSGSEKQAQASAEAEQLVEMVRAELAEPPEPVLLIIDDLHELRSAEALRQLEALLAALPSSARVVLSSRRDPPIRLHQLRLADELSEIRAGDLRFSEAETRELLAAARISLSDEGAAALHRHTEGWVAGLRLAVISLGRHDDPERFVAEFSGTDRAIGEYLMAEMLEGQPIAVQGMLLRTSLVDRMNGELADVLAGRPGSEQMLLALEDANAFVVSLDADRTWFRYHQLLADFLRLELRRKLGEEVAGIHRRAAHWFADHGDVVEAVRHTVAAGDWPDAARLVADHSFSWVLDGQAGTIDAVVKAFPEGASADHPDLALAHAASELNHGRLDEAAAQLALAESHVASAPGARRQRLAVAIASLRLALARRSGRLGDVAEQVNLLDASVSGATTQQIVLGSELRAVALLNLGIVETWSRRFDDAERHLSEGAALARTIGRPYLEVACRAHQVFPTRLVSVGAARERGRQVVELAERNHLGDRPILAPALAGTAFWAIWMGDFDEGERALHRAWEVAEPRIDPAAAVLLHLVTGQLHLARKQLHAALEALAVAARLQSRLTGVQALATPVVGWLAATQARLGMFAEARETLTEFPAEPDRMGFLHNALAVIHLAQGDPAAALAAIGDLYELGTPPGPPFTVVESHLLAGIAHLGLGDQSTAVAAAEEALAAAEPDRLMFPFAMAEANDLLAAVPGHQTAHAALLADVLDLLRGEAPPSGDDGYLPALEDLSPAELRVLRFLPTNLTRPEIAAELYVSVNTVNTHIRSIYSKLGTSDRSGAVRRARDLRLLSAERSRLPA